MKIKELIEKLGMFNPEQELIMRLYGADESSYQDFNIKYIRITKEGKIVISNQCGVE